MTILSHVQRFSKEAFRWWLVFAHALGYINTKLLLTVFYVLIIGPVWLVCLLLRIDFLERTWKQGRSYWKVKVPVDHSPTATRHQF